MTPDNSALVPFELVPVRDAAGMYRGGNWAEPDLDAAAEILRSLAADEDRYEALARAGHDYVANSGDGIRDDAGALVTA